MALTTIPASPRLGRRRRLVGLVTVIALAGSLGVVVVPWLQHRTRTRGWSDGVNVILISMDTTRRDHLGPYGYHRATSPNIDSLANEGLVFDRCVAVANWTLPAHASMLTGLFPTSHGAHFKKGAPSPIPDDHHFLESSLGVMNSACVSLPEVLKDYGYRTKAVIGNPGYLQRAFQLDQGFDDYDDRCPCYRCEPVAPGEEPPLAYRRAEEITNEALGWLDTDRGKPFFLFLNYMDPHVPYFPPAPYDTRFRNEEAQRVERSFAGARNWRAEFQWFAEIKKSLENRSTPLPPEIAAWLQCQYDGEIASMDAQIGRLMQWIKTHGIYERTLVIVTADHGENFGEHGLVDHAVSHYEPELAVPMIVKLPGQQRAGRASYGVQHVDVMPTVLDVLDVPVPAEVQGISMLASNARPLMVETYRPYVQGKSHRWAIYQGDFKLIVHADGSQELYDLRHDPGELKNLMTGSQKADEMAALLEQWRTSVLPIGNPQSPANLRAGTEEQLRDLGYVQ